MIVPQYVIQRDERYFYQASQFLPERWMASGEKARYNKENDAYFPFQIGESYQTPCLERPLSNGSI